MEFSHISVLLNETVDALDIKPDGIYVDCTTGGAGHSSEILRRLGENGRLIAIDQDPDAIEVIKERIGHDKRVTVVHSNFSELWQTLAFPLISLIRQKEGFPIITMRCLI